MSTRGNWSAGAPGAVHMWPAHSVDPLLDRDSYPDPVKGGSAMSDRGDAGFCSGGDELDSEPEAAGGGAGPTPTPTPTPASDADEALSPTDASTSEDSVEVRVSAIAPPPPPPTPPLHPPPAPLAGVKDAALKRKASEVLKSERCAAPPPPKKRRLAVAAASAAAAAAASAAAAAAAAAPSAGSHGPFRPWSSQHPPPHLPFAHDAQTRRPDAHRRPPRSLTDEDPRRYDRLDHPKQEDPLQERLRLDIDRRTPDDGRGCATPGVRIVKAEPPGLEDRDSRFPCTPGRPPNRAFVKTESPTTPGRKTDSSERETPTPEQARTRPRVKSELASSSASSTSSTARGEASGFSVAALLGGGSSTLGGSSDHPATPASAQRNYKNMTRERRIEANARERTRVHTISAAFDTLRRAVPAYSHAQKLSKLSVLRVACAYILTLSRAAGMDYSADASAPSLESCVDLVTRTIHTEGKLRRKRDE